MNNKLRNAISIAITNASNFDDTKDNTMLDSMIESITSTVYSNGDPDICVMYNLLIEYGYSRDKADSILCDAMRMYLDCDAINDYIILRETSEIRTITCDIKTAIRAFVGSYLVHNPHLDIDVQGMELVMDKDNKLYLKGVAYVSSKGKLTFSGLYFCDKENWYNGIQA